jgi:hypothetical protein
MQFSAATLQLIDQACHYPDSTGSLLENWAIALDQLLAYLAKQLMLFLEGRELAGEIWRVHGKLVSNHHWYSLLLRTHGALQKAAA